MGNISKNSQYRERKRGDKYTLSLEEVAKSNNLISKEVENIIMNIFQQNYSMYHSDNTIKVSESRQEKYEANRKTN